MKRNRFFTWLLCCCFCCVTASAQVSFVFVPAVQGRTLDGLLRVKLMNAASTGSASLLITVTEQRSGKVVSIKTRPFTIMPGLNTLPAGVITTAAINFGVSRNATLVRQSGFFAAGDYEYCFELLADKNGDVAGMQCFDHMLEPFSPLLLVTPTEQEQLCDKRPSLFWQPLLPAVPGMMYRLVLTEIKSGQAMIEALHYNLPLVNQMSIPGPFLFFPPSAPALQEGHHYAWQVTAYQGDIELANSEVWDFTIQCKDSVNMPPTDGFRDIEDLTKANFYIAAGRLQFSVRNIYDKTALEYNITCITDPTLKIKSLPKVSLQHGLNNIVIDMRDNKSFADGNSYLLTIKLPSGETRHLRFLYKNPATAL